jgi:hypothetical protein
MSSAHALKGQLARDAHDGRPLGGLFGLVYVVFCSLPLFRSAIGCRSQAMKTTLAIYDALLQANIPKAAARGVAEALEKDMEAVLATKADLRVLEEKLERRFENIDRRFELIEQKLQNLELRMTIKLGSLNVVAFSVFAVISKLL